MPSGRLASSFRDPSGFVFINEGVLFRQVNRSYEREFRLLHDSGLYDELSSAGILVRHEQVDLSQKRSPEAVAVIKPEAVGFISYPYEWSFTQLKDAALLTLHIQKRALARGMSLKDSSAFNVQFWKGKPIFIDTLSFEEYKEGEPWVAYRQFCQHFVAPLVLMSYVDPRMGRSLRGYIDGIPLDLTSKLLPWRTKWKPGIALHIHVHARAQNKITEMTQETRARKMSKLGLLGLIDNLEGLVKGLTWKPEGTVWGDYYEATNYSDQAMAQKAKLVEEFIESISPAPKSLWDLGANTGEFSRLASQKGILTVAWDLDTAAIEKCYLDLKQHPDPNLLPLVQDLTNPSPALGWANSERESFTGRGPADALMALALVHHLAIGNNVPLEDIAYYFASLGNWLIIEFVPKEDSQVQRLLQSREDVFDQYTQQEFERTFSSWFDLTQKAPIPGTVRTLYLFKTKG